MKAMDLLAQDFGSITFQDVVDFCDQQIVENTELDYKQVVPRDLTKHFFCHVEPIWRVDHHRR